MMEMILQHDTNDLLNVQFIVIHTVKGFGIINKAEIDVFLELSCFLIKRSNSDLGTHIDSMKGAGKK